MHALGPFQVVYENFSHVVPPTFVIVGGNKFGNKDLNVTKRNTLEFGISEVAQHTHDAQLWRPD